MYIFGGNTGETPESLQRKREVAEALLRRGATALPQNLPEGMVAVAQALSGRIGLNALDKRAGESRAKSDASFDEWYKANMPAREISGTGGADVATGSTGGDYFDNIRAAESGGNPNAKNPLSSATGLYQWTDGTWAEMMRKHPELGLTADGRGNPDQEEKAIRAFTAGNADILKSAGIEPTGGNLYAAHFLGAGGARNVLTQPDNASVAAIVGQGVVKANPFLARMTVGDFKRWTASKGGNDTLAGGEANDTLGGRTLQGPPLYRPFNPNERRDNRDGTYSTEVSTTWQTPDGQWKNIPSLWMGPQGPKQFDPGDEQGILGAARNYEQINGPTFNSFPTLQEAEAAAVARSRAGGAGAGNGQLRETWGQPDPQRFGHGIDTRTGAPSSFSEPDPERFGPTTAPKGDRLASAFQAQPPLTPEGVTVPTMLGDEKPAPRPTPRPRQAPAVDPVQTAAVPPPAMQPRGIVSPRAEDNGYTRGPGAAPANLSPQQAVAGALMRRQAATTGAPPVGNAPASPTGGIPGVSPSTAAMLSDPNLSEGQRAMVLAVLKREMDAQDPNSQLDLEKKRLEVDALRNPQDRNLLSPEAEAQKLRIAQAGRPETNVTVGGEPSDGELRKSLDKKTGEVWAGYQETGANSAAMSQDMQVLDELIKVAPQGPITGRLAEMFPGVSSAGDAFQSVVKRVAPTLRAPGSGATSDIEYDGMLRSLPALRNTPEANTMIAEIMKSKAAINIERARIVDAYSNGEISASYARKAMAELDKRSIMTPEMKKALEGVGGGENAGAAGGPAIGAVQDGYRFKGGAPADPNSWEPVR